MKIFAKIRAFFSSLIDKAHQKLDELLKNKPELTETLAATKQLVVEAVGKAIPIAKTLPIRIAIDILDFCDLCSMVLHGWLFMAMKRLAPARAS